MIKPRWKSVDFSPKSFFLDIETTFRQIFLSNNLQCLPRGNPKKALRKHKDPITNNSFIEFYVGNVLDMDNIWIPFKYQFTWVKKLGTYLHNKSDRGGGVRWGTCTRFTQIKKENASQKIE